MSTHALIARATATGAEGRYHHSDGYPTHLGKVLFSLYRKVFKSDIDKMLTFLLDKHQAGWSFLGMPIQDGGVTDYSMKSGYVNDHETFYHKGLDGKADWSKPKIHGPRCYCHGDRHEKPSLITMEEGWQWAYVFHSGLRTMTIYENDLKVATVNLDGDEPQWEFIECGENLERCSHYAWKHFPELRGTIIGNLGTAKFLGTRQLDADDAYAVEISGVRYQKQGSGGGAILQRSGKRVWAALLTPPPGSPALAATGAKAFRFSFGSSSDQMYEDGSFYYPIFGYGKERKGDMRPYVALPGVKLLYPPTLKQPLGVFTAIRARVVDPDEPHPAPEHDDALTNFLCGRKFRDEED